MDHILRPAAATLPPVEVPFLCAGENICTAAEFFEWPKKHLRYDLPLAVFAAKIQSWLYFGLLSAFLDKDVPREEVLKQNPSGRYILDSRPVERLIREAYQSQPELLGPSEVNEEDRWARHVSAFTVALRVMNDIVISYLNSINDDGEANLWTSESHAAIFAVDVLIDLLETALETVPHLLSSRNLERRSLTATVRVFRNSVARTGRCLSLGWRLQPSSTDWYRLLFLPLNEDFRDHSLCLDGICIHHNINVSTYRTQHVETCQGCEFVEADQEVMKEYISEDHIPLAYCYGDSEGVLQLGTAKGSLLSDYTAISHVWSGGLGNFKHNSLPRCQLRRLMEIVDGLPQPPRPAFKPSELSFPPQFADKLTYWASLRKNCRVLFWLDTLCIPVSEEFSLYRSKAIHSMAQLYAGASKVLVLDPYLQLLPSEALRDDPSLLAMHIRISPWMARSWPLQEGAVAKNLFFRLKDRTILLDEDGYRKIGLPALRMLDYDPDKLSSSRSFSHSKFSDVWNELANRTTTEPRDVHGIFARLVDLSSEEILSLEEGERMKAIIRAQAKIPLLMLYQPNTDQNGSWVPQFPSPASGADIVYNFYGVLLVTEKGLVVKDPYHTFALLRKEDLPQSDNFILRLDNTNTQVRILQESTINGSRASSRESETIFVLSRVCSRGKPGHRGARFSVQKRKEAGIKLRFEAVVSWFCWSVSEVSLPQGTELVCEYLKGFGESGYEVLIDLGKSTSSQLSNYLRRQHLLAMLVI